MSRYHLHALTGAEGPDTVETISVDFDTFDEIPKRMAQLDEIAPRWRAATIIHIEDVPRLLEGSEVFGPATYLGPVVPVVLCGHAIPMPAGMRGLRTCDLPAGHDGPHEAFP